MKHFLAVVAVGGLLAFAPSAARADSPTCTAPEVKLSWPAVKPVWELC